MHPMFEAIDGYLDQNPARRIIWSTHDQSHVNLETGVISMTEHMRAALTYRKVGETSFHSTMVLKELQELSHSQVCLRCLGCQASSILE